MQAEDPAAEQIRLSFFTTTNAAGAARAARALWPVGPEMRLVIFPYRSRIVVPCVSGNGKKKLEFSILHPSMTALSVQAGICCRVEN